MESRVLIQELERLNGGQPDAEQRVLFAISKTSLFLVSESDPNAAGDDSVVVKLRLVSVEGRPTAYLFSSEETLRAWCERNGFEPHALPVHGGDLPFLMPPDTWIQIDPESSHGALLGPAMLSLLTQDMPDMQAVLVSDSNAETGFVMPARAADDKERSLQYAPPAEIKAAPSPASTQGPIKRKFAPKTNPTMMFQAPTLEPKPAETQPKRERSMTSSNLRKIIKSLPPGTE